MGKLKTYLFDGEVWSFGKNLQHHYVASTSAESPEKAWSNIAFNWKKEHGYLPSKKITLKGTITPQEKLKS